mmetsp:Transcript_20234/g.14934  ORF Transcript_20234/g.14934 Transcript_20234/m.14934 type:complete len:84 (+) Transcript_20234:1539-1790(+)
MEKYKSKEELNMFKLWGIKKLQKNCYENLRKDQMKSKITSDKNVYSEEDEDSLEGLPDSADAFSDAEASGMKFVADTQGASQV